MAINVEVKNKSNESAINLIRRFSRRVNRSGILSKARTLRYRKRDHSNAIQKKQKLRTLDRQQEVDRLIKLGKLPDRRARQMDMNKDDK